jgi:hypothetical protein
LEFALILADIFLSPNLACLSALERACSVDSKYALAFEIGPKMAEQHSFS